MKRRADNVMEIAFLIGFVAITSVTSMVIYNNQKYSLANSEKNKVTFNNKKIETTAVQESIKINGTKEGSSVTMGSTALK